MANRLQQPVQLYRNMAWRTWWILAKECGSLGPRQSTSKSLDLALDRIIDDIAYGRDIRDFLKAKDVFLHKQTNGRGCSTSLLKFLQLLRSHMAMQGVLDIEPLRAAELLYDHVIACKQAQHALRIMQESPEAYSFVTTSVAEQKFNEVHRLTLPMRHAPNDWNNLRSRRDKSAEPKIGAS